MVEIKIIASNIKLALNLKLKKPPFFNFFGKKLIKYSINYPND